MWSWWYGSSSARNDDALIVLSIVTSLFILWILFDTQTKGKLHLPPGPRGLPIVGYLPYLGSDPRPSFKKLANTYGPLFKVKLGTKECIVVSSPSLVKEVLKDQDVIFANRNPTITHKIASYGATEVAFSSYSPEWRKVKKIFVSEIMSNASIDRSFHFRKQHVKKMMNKINLQAGGIVDVGELIFTTIMNSLMSMVWGETMKVDVGDAMATKFQDVAAEFVKLLGAPNISDYLPYLAWLDLQGIARKMKSVNDQIEGLFDMAINQHNNGAENNLREDFLGYLLKLTKSKDPATSLTLAQVKAILMDTLMAGTDTTAMTVEWAMAELLQHPNVMSNVQQELSEKIGDSLSIDEADLPELKYLNAVLKETLRLHTIGPFLVPHRSNKTTALGGYTIPQDCMVFLNAEAIHRDPNIWKDPLDFQPERFLNGSEKSDFLSMGSEFQYIPFGYGRRMCPGIGLAEKMSLYVLASMLHAFQWRLPDGTHDVDMSETFGLVVKKTISLIAVPSPRLSRLKLYSFEE